MANRYEIVEDADRNKFEHMVISKMADGLIPCGGVAVIERQFSDGFTKLVYVQAMYSRTVYRGNLGPG